VLALDRRIRDLKDVEDAHGDVVGQMRKGSGHADEADFPLIAERYERLDSLVGLQLVATRRQVDLEEVEVIRAEPPQTLLDPGADVLGSKIVREGRVAPGGGSPRRHPHFDARKYSSRRWAR